MIDYVIVTVQGYLPLSVRLPYSNTETQVFVPPMTLVGLGYIESLIGIVRGGDTLENLEPYDPGFSMQLTGKGHYCTYLVLSSKQIVTLMNCYSS